LANIRKMSGQIRDHYHKGQRLGPGYDLKRGRGGIRECEFFAQAHQLIHGGRDPGLRMADTRTALAALAERDRIGVDEATTLSSAYELLRTIEHRLQMLDDRQTHSLPENAADLDRAARLHGLDKGDSLVALLSPVVAGVGAIYDGLAGEEEESARRLPDEGLPLEDELSAMGYADPAAVAQRLARWRSGQLRAIRSSSAREAFEMVLPKIMAALAHAPDPANAIARFDNVIEALPSAINFFNLLDARPALLQLLADILSYAPTLADALARRGELLEGLIDTSAYRLPESCEALEAELGARIVDDDYQTLLDLVRAFVGEKRFSFGVQLVEGQQDPLAVSHAYAMLAEIAVAKLTAATVAEFESAHGKVPGGELAILALRPVRRRGADPCLRPRSHPALLRRSWRGIRWSASAGRDAIFQPAGAARQSVRSPSQRHRARSTRSTPGCAPRARRGCSACRSTVSRKYQREEAWTWEHMALTRARPVYGSAEARAQLEAIIAETLAMPHDAGKLADDIIKMRADMAMHKPPKGALDVKLLPGGLVDAEFAIHALQLRFGQGLYPQLDRAADALIAAGLLPEGFAPAQALLTQLLVLLRLVAPDCEIPPEPAQAVVAKALGFANWDEVMTAVDVARGVISAEWQGIEPRLKS
jgi:glutamate-ammonia-ligase adenylyltransferase